MDYKRARWGLDYHYNRGYCGLELLRCRRIWRSGVYIFEYVSRVGFAFHAFNLKPGFKIITIIGLLIMAFILCVGGGPESGEFHEPVGFRYWNNPGAMREYLVDGRVGYFLGFLKSFVNAVFAFLGAEVIAVAACETKHPRHNIPKAVRRTFWRILIFYVFGVLAIGVLVPYNDAGLAAAIEKGAKGAAASPWVVAIQNAGIKGLPHIINAVILTSA